MQAHLARLLHPREDGELLVLLVDHAVLAVHGGAVGALNHLVRQVVAQLALHRFKVHAHIARLVGDVHYPLERDFVFVYVRMGFAKLYFWQKAKVLESLFLAFVVIVLDVRTLLAEALRLQKLLIV